MWMSPDYDKQARHDQSDRHIITCLRSGNPLESLEKLVEETHDRVAACVLSEEYEKLGFGYRSKVQAWRDCALANLDDRDLRNIKSAADRIILLSSSTAEEEWKEEQANTERLLSTASANEEGYVTWRKRFELINKEIDECLHSSNVIRCLESIARRTNDPVAAYVLAAKLEKAGNQPLARQWRDFSFSGQSSKDVWIIKRRVTSCFPSRIK